MARIRSIHPGLTSDESYMSMSMTAKAAWTPLWMQCDDHGIFEWKPIVLKALIFPADNIDFSAVLDELVRLDCVRRLEIEGRPYGMVRNFARYQRPKNPSYRHFKPENIPTDVASYIGVKGVATPVLPQSSTSTTEILPQRKEEGGDREEEGRKESIPTPAKPQARASENFERFKAAFPRRDGANPWQPAEKKFNALVKTGVDPEVMIAAAGALAREEGARGNSGTKFIPQAITWLNQQRFTDYAAVAALELDAERPAGFYAKFGSEEQDAWDAYGRESRGKPYPRDKAGGWNFPSRWPPGYVPLSSSSSPLEVPTLRRMDA